MPTAGTTIQQEYKARRRVKAREYLGGACAVCGREDDLQFDHVDPTSKVIDVSEAIGRCWAWRRLIVELDKCQLLCRPHHREKSMAEGSLRGPAWNRVENPKHGSGARYNRLGCRCWRCRKWRRDYRAGVVDYGGNAR